MSIGAAKVTSCTSKSVLGWSDALNDQQCGVHDNDVSNNQQSGLNDNGVRNEFYAVQEAFETTCPVSRNLAW